MESFFGLGNMGMHVAPITGRQSLHIPPVQDALKTIGNVRAISKCIRQPAALSESSSVLLSLVCRDARIIE